MDTFRASDMAKFTSVVIELSYSLHTTQFIICTRSTGWRERPFGDFSYVSYVHTMKSQACMYAWIYIRDINCALGTMYQNQTEVQSA